MNIRNHFEVNTGRVRNIVRKQAIAKSLSIRAHSKHNRNSQIFAVVVCALSGSYIAIVIEDKLLLTYVVLSSVYFFMASFRAYSKIHLRIDKLLSHYCHIK